MSFKAGGSFGHSQNEGEGQTGTMLPSSSSCAFMKSFYLYFRIFHLKNPGYKTASGEMVDLPCGNLNLEERTEKGKSMVLAFLC